MTKIKTILFIDDDNISLYLNKMLVEQLRIAGKSETLHNPWDALEYIQKNYCYAHTKNSVCTDLIFLDIHMPGLDGFEFMQELEKINNLDRSRFLIIMLTASLNQIDMEKASGYGDKIYAYLSKPLSEEDLKKLHENLLAQFSSE